ncbi:MAG: BRCT domain-containing protein [Planctomycetota bacterium]|jgi:uncharacterized coiled-coil protein SlyX
MALARPQVAGGITGLKAALIVFICVTIAALTFAIIIYTNYDDLNNRVQDANIKADKANQRMRDMQEQQRDMTFIMIGESTDDPAEIKQTIDTALKQIMEDPRVKKADIEPDSPVLTILQGLYGMFAANTEALEQLTREREDLTAQVEKLNQNVAAAQKEFAEKTEELTAKFAELEQKGNQNREQWDQQVDKLGKEKEAAEQTAADQLKKERERVDELGKTVADHETTIKQLRETVAEFRPSGDKLAGIQNPDGRILKVVTGADIVYIDIGSRHGLMRGMTFSVHSSYEPVAQDGKGKADIEVVRPFESTAECRVNSTTKGDPIVQGDVVANPVFDRSRQFNFMVAGDFDLDFDGKIDDPGGEQTVKPMIRRYGGKVVSQIDTRTDFVVLGAAPPLPMKLSEGASDEAVERNAERAKARQTFDTVAREAKALSVPILTRTQFLHFVGFGVPKHVKDDRPVS